MPLLTAPAQFFLAFLAEAALQQGQVADGWHTVTEALRLTATNFDRSWEAEVYRLQGELLLHAACGRSQSPCATAWAQRSFPPPTQSRRVRHAALTAEECFQQALAIARQQGAKALELRAAMSLSRLWQAQGKPAAAQALLKALKD